MFICTQNSEAPHSRNRERKHGRLKSEGQVQVIDGEMQHPGIMVSLHKHLVIGVEGFGVIITAVIKTKLQDIV